jgi:exopolysaccharide biosynthesis polyprenyl glycosylphosphotransferase
LTPQLAARLTIHEDAGQTAIDHNGALEAGRSPVAFTTRRLKLVESGERALPALLRRESVHRRLLALADVVAATVALVSVLAVLGEDRPGVAALAAMPLIVVLFKIAGLYDRDQLRLVHSTLDELPILVQLTGLYALSVTILQPVLLEGRLGGDQVAGLWLASFAAIVGGRMFARWLAGHASPLERCLVIGAPETADRIRRKLTTGRVRAAVIATLQLDGEEIDRIGSPESIHTVVEDLNVDRVIIAPTTADAGRVAELIRIAKAADVRVSVLPTMLEAVGSTVEFEDVDGMTILGIRPFGLSRSSRLLKRAFDLVAACLGLVAIGPLMGLIAIAIRFDSKGPVFFRQVRVGRDGRHFRIFKFRSMAVDADQQKDRLRAFNEVGEGMFKLSRDPRVTRIGNLLRQTSLDELPQLFNVLRGEMSLVGPRPLVVDEDALVLGLDRSRLHLTPGMTGPWQVLGGRVPMREMVAIDYLYVASWSLWLDLKLLLRTVRHVCRGGNV